MILSGRDIKLYIETGKLIVDPITDEQFQQNGIDLILESVITPAELTDCGRAMIPALEHPTYLKRLTFSLAGTREHLKMPDDLMAFVELRSTWARTGLLLPPTIVDAGFEGNLTLEVFAARAVMVPYGHRFAHLIFSKLSGPAVPYQGKYQGQTGVTGPRPDR